MLKDESNSEGMSPILGWVLSYSVFSAMILFLIGLILLMAGGGLVGIDEQMSLQQIADSISKLSPEGVIGLGIIVVVATPLIRLLTTTMLATGNRDVLIATITVISLALIVLSFIIKTAA